MREFSIMELKRMSDDMIIKSIGAFIRHDRLEKNITQEQLATKAGINRTTLSDLELGRRCTLITLIQTLRSLDQLGVLKHFKVFKELSPIELADLEIKKRKRASRSNENRDQGSDW